MNFAGRDDDCDVGERCWICAAGECDCIYGEWCRYDDDCFFGCDTPGGCPVYRCMPMSGTDHGACTPGDWPAPECRTSPGDCTGDRVRVRLDGVEYCVDRCSSHDDCAHCCGRTTAGDQVCAPVASYCAGSSACPSGTAPLHPGGPCAARPSSCTEGWAVCDCPEEHGAWCHPGCDEYRRGEGGPGTYCGGVAC